MKNTSRMLAGLLAAGLCGFAASPSAAQSAASQIKARIESLQRSLKDEPIADPDLATVNSMAEGSLRAASEALHAGRLYLSLEKIAEASNLIHGARAAADKAAVVRGGLPAFEARWSEVSLKLTALDQQASARDWSHTPAAIRALSEAAQGRSLPLLEGGRGFATATGPTDGLFYVGEAKGEAEFAQFGATLTLSGKATPFPLRSLLPELERLQEKANAAFQPPRSIELHPRFIALNSTLKLAQELDARKFYAGALYEYLEAVRHYGMLDAAPLDAGKQAVLKEAIAAAQKKLAASTRDDSIAQLFLERAASQTAHEDGSAPSTDEWRSAQTIVDQVLPAYFAAEKPPSPLQTPSGKTVDITLVRWPYT
jgi:hypothetical protein